MFSKDFVAKTIRTSNAIVVDEMMVDCLTAAGSDELLESMSAGSGLSRWSWCSRCLALHFCCSCDDDSCLELIEVPSRLVVFAVWPCMCDCRVSFSAQLEFFSASRG